MTQLQTLKKEFITLFRKASHRNRPHTVFSDFCAAAALALSNLCDKQQFVEREAEYESIRARYEPDEFANFPHMLAILFKMAEAEMTDHLGALFMELELGDSGKGQFFTPYTISKLMAGMIITDAPAIIEKKGFIHVSEPTCGAGGMVIAAADSLSDQKINYQHTMYVTAQDLDITAVHMTYIQMTLYHIPGVVIHGNSLSNECRSKWFTLAHYISEFDMRLFMAAIEEQSQTVAEQSHIVDEPVQSKPAIALIPILKVSQFEMF